MSAEEGHGEDRAGTTHHRMMMRDYRGRLIVSAILTVPILALSPLIQDLLGVTFEPGGYQYALFALSTPVYLYGGWPFLTGLVKELGKRRPGMMTLIAVAISVAYIYSSAVVFGLEGKFFFWELATLIDVMLLGHWVEMRSVLGASRALEELVSIIPSEAHRLEDGDVVDVEVGSLRKGDIVMVRPGERVPVDGTVRKGESSVNEALVTGESVPVDKGKEDEVIAGSINGDGPLEVEVGRTGEDTYLNQVISLVRQAQEARSSTQDLADRAAFLLTVIALTVGAVTFSAWYLLGEDTVFAIERGVTVMVITCPHALGLAIPLVVAVSTSLAAGSGLLVRDRQAFERAKDLEIVVFDKTGTLTRGEFGVTDILAWEMGEDEALRWAASLESGSEHPIAKGIVDEARERGLETMEATDLRAVKGKGVEGRVEGSAVRLTSPAWAEELGLDPERQGMAELRSKGRTVIVLFIDDRATAALALADIVREESKEAVSELRDMGLRCVMLTGDNNEVAEAVARELGMDEFYAEVLPDRKAERIEGLRKEGTVAMVGDGINDAPALASADVGIAIGAGTNMAMESADIVLVRNDPRDVIGVVNLAGRTYSKMLQNLLWATGYNAAAIPLAAGVLSGYGIVLSPAVGAAVMSLSTVIVAINARTLRIDREGERTLT